MGSEIAYALVCFGGAAVVTILRLKPMEKPERASFPSDRDYSMARDKYFNYLLAPLMIGFLLLLGISFIWPK